MKFPSDPAVERPPILTAGHRSPKRNDTVLGPDSHLLNGFFLADHLFSR